MRWPGVEPTPVGCKSSALTTGCVKSSWPSLTRYNSTKVDQFSYFFTDKFRKDLRRKTEFKLPPPLTSVAALPCEKQVVNCTAVQNC